jgi:hypothetical protein
MMAQILGLIFPPKLGKIENHGPSVTLHLIDTGVINAIEPDPWSWAGNTRVWHDDAWRHPEEVQWRISKPERSTYLTTLS